MDYLLAQLVGNEPFGDGVPGSAADLDIEVDQAATAAQHAGDCPEVFFFSCREIGYREIDRRAALSAGPQHPTRPRPSQQCR